MRIHRQIKGPQFEVFEESEGGQHFMFIENPEKFNRLVMEYFGELAYAHFRRYVPQFLRLTPI
jgi:non-heme chloroperoxidase